MFAETAIALREAFTLTGLPGVDVYEGVGFGNAPWAERSAWTVWILIGLNLMPSEWTLPVVYVVYQMEQLTSPWMTEHYLWSLAAAIQVWDFAPSHVKYWRSAGLSSSFVPLSVPACWLATDVELASWQGVDILFYGARNDRREAIKNRLIAELAPFKVAFYLDFDLFGAERDRVVQGAKLVLNVHYYQAATLEVHRINYLLAKGKCVLSEPSSDAYLDARYASAVVFSKVEDLASTALALLRDEHCRRIIELHAKEFAASLQAEASSWLSPATAAGVVSCHRPTPLSALPVAAWDEDDDQASPRPLGNLS